MFFFCFLKLNKIFKIVRNKVNNIVYIFIFYDLNYKIMVLKLLFYLRLIYFSFFGIFLRNVYNVNIFFYVFVLFILYK